MKLEKKISLAARTLGVGKNRIVFNKNRLSEIKEAITKQDIRELKESGAIRIREIKGRRAIEKKGRRRAGSIRQPIINKKQIYVKLTRKLRKHLKNLKDKNKIENENYKNLRKEIRQRAFRSLAHMKENIEHKK